MERAGGPWRLFERTARRYGDRLAVRDGRRLTYGELHRLASEAAALRAAGAGEGHCVLVGTARTADAVVALLAVTAAGAVPVPFDVDGPLERLRRIAGASGARLALVDDSGRAGAGVAAGYRIEAGEIVSALCAHPAVEEAAAVVTDSLPWGETIVCAAVPCPGAAVTELELRRHAGTSLPGYMRPGRIVLIDRLPRLTSGKLDSAALRRRIEGLVRA